MKKLCYCTALGIFSAAMLSLSLCARAPIPASRQSTQNQNTTLKPKIPTKAPGTQPQAQSDGTSKEWIGKDVANIIADIECSASSTTPGATANECKEERLRRFAYANEHFASSVTGWMTDRGRIYILWGNPDSVDAHPHGGSHRGPSPYPYPYADNGYNRYPYEDWHYDRLEGLSVNGLGDNNVDNSNIIFEFGDTPRFNDYHLFTEPQVRDAVFRQSHLDPTSPISDICDEWEKNWKTRNFEGLHALYSEDANFLPAIGIHVIGRDAIGDYFKRIADLRFGERLLLGMGTDTSRNLAYVTGSVQYTMRGSAAPVNGYYVMVLRKNSQDKWTIVYQSLLEISSQRTPSERRDQ